MFDQWAQNITGAAGANSDNMYQNYANLGTINAAPEAITADKMASQASIDEANRQAAAREKALASQHELDKIDPGKAQMKLNPDGSYSYYNGIGEKLNINQFSLLTGKRPDEILADSENPQDQKFVADYKTMKNFATAWVNGDNATLQALRVADPKKFNELISTYKTPSDMVAAFRDYYSGYYGDPNAAAPAKNFAPTAVAGLADDPTGKALAGRIASSTLKETMTPTSMEVPNGPGGFNQFLSNINPWSPQQSALRKYDEAAATNPWLAYQKYLQK